MAISQLIVLLFYIISALVLKGYLLQIIYWTFCFGLSQGWIATITNVTIQIFLSIRLKISQCLFLYQLFWLWQDL